MTQRKKAKRQAKRAVRALFVYIVRVADSTSRPFGQLAQHPREIRDRAFKLYCEGKLQTDIAYELQIPVGTIYGWASREKWDLRKVASEAGADAETSTSVAKALAKVAKTTEPSDLDLVEKQTRYQALMGDAAIRVAEHVATLQGDALVANADKLLKADQIARKALKLETEKPSTVIQIGVLANSPAKQERKHISDTPVEAIILDT